MLSVAKVLVNHVCGAQHPALYISAIWHWSNPRLVRHCSVVTWTAEQERCEWVHRERKKDVPGQGGDGEKARKKYDGEGAGQDQICSTGSRASIVRTPSAALRLLIIWQSKCCHIESSVPLQGYRTKVPFSWGAGGGSLRSSHFSTAVVLAMQAA